MSAAATRPTLVLVSGQPGSGKTTLARPLAVELDLPLLSKDATKEALADQEDQAQLTVEQSQALGAAAFDVIFRQLRDGMSAVVEASWNPLVAAADLAALPHRIVEVHCRCEPSIARDRYIKRSPKRHWVHLDSARFDDARLWTPSSAGPLGVGHLTVEVDTDRPTDIALLGESILGLLA